MWKDIEIMMKRVLESALNATIAVVRAALVVSLISLPILASQNNLYNSTTGTLSGLTMVQGFNNALDSVNTCNSGASAPANQLSGSPSAGNCWYNTATGALSFFDGADWLTVGYIDAANHVFTPIVGSGAQNSVASASTTNLCGASGAAPTQSFLTITGTTTITGFGSNCQIGQEITLSFAGALTLTQGTGSGGTPLNLPNNGNNITTAAGDIAVARYLGSGNWQVVLYQRATGAALTAVGLSISAASLAASALASYGQPVNFMLGASIASNQLTLSVLGVNGSAPSSSNPVLVGYRSQTLANVTNGIVLGTISASLSFTIGATESMSCTTGVACPLWVELICQTESSGACSSNLIGASVQSASGACYPLNEDVLQSTGSGTSGGTTAGTIQTSVASLSGKAIRIVGYVVATWTSGTGWGSLSQVQAISPGMKKPCDTVQEVFASSTSASITPTRTVNLVRINNNTLSQCGLGGTASYASATIQLLRGATLIASNQIAVLVGSSNYVFSTTTFPILDSPKTTSSTTYSVSFVNNTCGGGSGIVGNTYFLLDEIMGALEPANDNRVPLSLVG